MDIVPAISANCTRNNYTLLPIRRLITQWPSKFQSPPFWPKNFLSCFFVFGKNKKFLIFKQLFLRRVQVSFKRSVVTFTELMTDLCVFSSESISTTGLTGFNGITGSLGNIKISSAGLLEVHSRFHNILEVHSLGGGVSSFPEASRSFHVLRA